MTSPPEVDELRTKLRALGYLDAGVDRFVLAPVHYGRSIAALALGSSARIGLLAGLLLGPSAAVGLGARLPGLITGPRDAAVVAAYLGVMFGAAAMIVSFAAACAAAFLMRRSAADHHTPKRAGRLATTAGGIVTAACLVYLTLWWRAADPASGWDAVWWTTLALLVAVGISLLLGRTVQTAATAIMAVTAGSGELPTRSDRSWKLSLSLAGTAFLGAAVLLLATAPRESGAPNRPSDEAFAVVPTGLRVTVIGIDGFDPVLFRRLAERGDVPTLKRLASGAVALVRTGPDRDPARVWTSFATGLPAAQHGVESIETRRMAGMQGTVPPSQSPLLSAVSAATDLVRLSRPVAASAMERREKTFWEVAAEAGLRTAVVNWWATWPATVDGIVISDRAVLRLERGGDLNAEIAPPQVYDALRRDWPALRRLAADRAQHAFVGESQEILATLRRSAELDALQVQLARDEAIGRPDLLTIYLPGLDIAQFALLGAPDAKVSPSVLSERVEALTQYYSYLDELLVPLVGETEAGSLTMLLTHPGRVSSGAESLLALTGSQTQSEVRVDAHPGDIAPTILYSLGVPTSQELTGRPLTALFSPFFVNRYAVRLVTSYGRRDQPDTLREDTDLDAEAIERLRSLGYVQ